GAGDGVARELLAQPEDLFEHLAVVGRPRFERLDRVDQTDALVRQALEGVSALATLLLRVHDFAVRLHDYFCSFRGKSVASSGFGSGIRPVAFAASPGSIG